MTHRDQTYICSISGNSLVSTARLTVGYVILLIFVIEETTAFQLIMKSFCFQLLITFFCFAKETIFYDG